MCKCSALFPNSFELGAVTFGRCNGIIFFSTKNKKHTMGLNQNQVVILMQHTDGRQEIFGGLAEICRVHRYTYNTLIKKKYPFSHDGWAFSKLPFRKVSETKKQPDVTR